MIKLSERLDRNR